MPLRRPFGAANAAGVIGRQVRHKSNFHTATRIRGQYMPINAKNVGDWSVVLERYTHTGPSEEEAYKRLQGAENDFRWLPPTKYDGFPFITAVDGVPPKVSRLTKWLYDNLLEPFSFSRHFGSVRGDSPLIGRGALISQGAQIMGLVVIDHESAIHDKAIVRGWPFGFVEISDRTHIMEGTVIEGARGITDPKGEGQEGHVLIGRGSIIGANCVIRGPVKIGSEVLIGDNCVIEEGAVIGDRAVIGANSVVLRGQWIPDQEVWAGNPAKVIRPVGPIEFGRLQDLSFFLFEVLRVYHNAETEYGSGFMTHDKKIYELAREMQQLMTDEWVYSKAPADLQNSLTPYDERGIPTRTWCDRVNDALIPHQLRGVYEDWTYAKHKQPHAEYQA